MKKASELKQIVYDLAHDSHFQCYTRPGLLAIGLEGMAPSHVIMAQVTNAPPIADVKMALKAASPCGRWAPLSFVFPVEGDPAPVLRKLRKNFTRYGVEAVFSSAPITGSLEQTADKL